MIFISEFYILSKSLLDILYTRNRLSTDTDGRFGPHSKQAKHVLMPCMSLYLCLLAKHLINTFEAFYSC